MEAAFSQVEPGEITLHEAQAIDGHGTEGEQRNARKLDPERDWRDVPIASLEDCPSALSHLDPPAWRFYLPAFMRAVLRDLRNAEGSHGDPVIYSLDLPDRTDLVEVRLSRFRILSANQAEVVRKFLVLISEHYGPICQEALERHWSSAAGV
jgi:hypothetical protein